MDYFNIYLFEKYEYIYTTVYASTDTAYNTYIL